MTIRGSLSRQNQCRLADEDKTQTPKYAELNVKWTLDFIRTNILIL